MCSATNRSRTTRYLRGYRFVGRGARRSPPAHDAHSDPLLVRAEQRKQIRVGGTHALALSHHAGRSSLFLTLQVRCAGRRFSISCDPPALTGKT